MPRRFGTIYQRTGRDGFYVRFRRDGREIGRYGGGTRRIADKKLTKAAALFDDGASFDAVLAEVFGDFTGERLTFRDAVPHYLASAERRLKASTVQEYTIRLAAMCRDATWPAKDLSAIRPEDLARWTERRLREVSGPTVNRDLASVSAVFKWAKRMGYCDENPTRQVERYSEKGRQKRTYLTSTEARALVDAAAADFRPVLLCALSTGMRRGEILALAWDLVDLKRGTVAVKPEDEKAGRGRTVPMTPELRVELVQLQSERKVFRVDGRDPVFVRTSGRPWTVQMLRRAFSRALSACEVIPPAKRARVTFHALRHTAASLMAQNGVPLFDVGGILGHGDYRTTMRYAHFAPDAGRAAIDKLGKALALAPPRPK